MRTKFIVVLIILLSLVLRIYHFSSLFHWSMDEDYWAYLALNIATRYHLPLIGGNIGGTGFNTTPYLVYLFGIVSVLIKGNPLGLGFFAVLLGGFTTFLTYYLGKKIFGQKIALISTFIFAISAMCVLLDRRFRNPMVIPVLTVFLYYFSHQISLGRRRGVIGASLVVAFMFSVHGLAVVAFAYIFVVLVIYGGKNLREKFTNLIIFGAIVGLSLAPMLVFESKHNFVQTKRFLQGITLPKTPSSKKITLFDRTLNLYGIQGSSLFYYPRNLETENIDNPACPNYPDIGIDNIALVALLITSLYLAYKSWKKDKRFQLLLLLIIVNILGSAVYPEPPKPYFLAFIFLPLIFSSGSLFLNLAKTNILNKSLVFALLLIFALINISKIAYSHNSYSYSQKFNIVYQVLSHVKNENFSLNLSGSDECQLFGYRYLFTFLNHEPVKSYADQDFLWLYDRRLPSGPAIRNIQIVIKPNDITEKNL